MSIRMRDLEKDRQKEAEKRRFEEEKALKEFMKYKDHHRHEQKRFNKIQ